MSIRIASLSIPLALACSTAHAEIVKLATGVLVDTATATTYLMRDKGGISARDNDNGEELWRSTIAQQPLAIGGDGVMVAMAEDALVGTIELRTINTANGDELARVTVDIDDTVQASINDTLRHRFRILAADAANPSIIAWQYTARRPSGMLPEEDRMLQTEPTIGAFSLNPATATTAVLPSVPDGVFVRARDSVTLPVPDRVQGRRFLSEDKRHTLVSRLAETDDFRRYEWSVYDDRGQVVTHMTHFVSWAPFIISSGKLVMVEPPHAFRDSEDGSIQHFDKRVVAYAINGEDADWDANVRDTDWTGQIPH